MTETDEAEVLCYDLIQVDGLSYTDGLRLALAQTEFKWKARKNGAPSGPHHIFLEGADPHGDLETLVLTTDRSFAAMSEILRERPAAGFPVVKRVHGFVDYHGKAYWAILQTTLTSLQTHIVDPFIPEIAQGQVSDFNYAWEEIQADPVEAPDYHGDLDIRKFYYEIEDFESSTNIAFSEMRLTDFSVDESNPTSPRLVVTALEKAEMHPDLSASIIAKIPVISVEVIV
jgi:hypothetical protein